MSTKLFQYDPQTLKELQALELDMLRKIDQICRKYNVQYFLVWGSMLGAMRHKGFIPWDDDIDVGMLREEYEKLRQIPTEEWGDYVLSDPKDTDPVHRLPYPQLYKRNTVFETEYHWKHDKVKNNPEQKKMPIWLDIFVLDHVKDAKICYKNWPKVIALSKLYYWAKCRVTPYKEDSLPVKIACAGKTCIYYLLNIVPNPELMICKKIEKICVSYPGTYVTDYYASSKGHLSPSRYDDFFPLTEAEFNGLKTWIPKNAHRLMTDRYGDYMKMPPEEKRINHPPYILDFGDERGNVIQNTEGSLLIKSQAQNEETLMFGRKV